MTSLDYRQRQIESYEVMTKNMSTIIGIYKGALEVYKSELEIILNSGCVGDRETDTLKFIISSMDNLISENEERWNTRMTKKD